MTPNLGRAIGLAVGLALAVSISTYVLLHQRCATLLEVVAQYGPAFSTSTSENEAINSVLIHVALIAFPQLVFLVTFFVVFAYVGESDTKEDGSPGSKST
jgi:hypothetical protein